MIDLDFKYKVLISDIKSKSPFQPDIGIILGSGLGDFAGSVSTRISIPTASLTGYPESTVQGHMGFIHFSTYKEKKLVLFQGRIHPYEGYSLSQCILPAFISHSLKVKYLIITNAAGGINPDFSPGDLMLISSLNSVFLKKELSILFGTGTLDQKNNIINFPSKRLNKIIEDSALEEKIAIKKGVYFYTKGPSYETPAEIKMIAKFADAVGMSTVHEALFAASNNIETSCISCITNYAAGITSDKLSHKEVMETADRVRLKFERLIKKTIESV